MSYFRRLPVFLRGMSIVSSLYILIAFALLAEALSVRVFAFPHVLSLEGQRADVIGLNCACLSMAVSNVIRRYTVRFREPDGTLYPLDTWRLQARAILWRSLLPACAIVLALLISPERILFALVEVTTMAAGLVNLVIPALAELENTDARRRASPPTRAHRDLAP